MLGAGVKDYMSRFSDPKKSKHSPVDKKEDSPHDKGRYLDLQGLKQS